MGGNPEFRSWPFPHVADKKSQPDWKSVTRDHPEGIKSAIKNSEKWQNVVNSSSGFVPNMAGSGTTRTPSQRIDDLVVRSQRRLSEKMAELASKISPLERSIVDLSKIEKKQKEAYVQATKEFKDAKNSKATPAEKEKKREAAVKSLVDLRRTRKEKQEKAIEKRKLEKQKERFEDIGQLSGMNQVTALSKIPGVTKDRGMTGTYVSSAHAREGYDQNKTVPMLDEKGDVAIDPATGLPRYRSRGPKKTGKGNITRLGDKVPGGRNPYERTPGGPTLGGIEYANPDGDNLFGAQSGPGQVSHGSAHEGTTPVVKPPTPPAGAAAPTPPAVPPTESPVKPPTESPVKPPTTPTSAPPSRSPGLTPPVIFGLDGEMIPPARSGLEPLDLPKYSGVRGPTGDPGASGTSDSTTFSTTKPPTTPRAKLGDPRTLAGKLARLEKEKQDRRDAREKARSEQEAAIKAERKQFAAAKGLPDPTGKPIHTVGTSIDEGILQGNKTATGLSADQGITRIKEEDEVDFEITKVDEEFENINEALSQLRYQERVDTMTLDKGGSDKEREAARKKLDETRTQIDEAIKKRAKVAEKVKKSRTPEAKQKRLLKKRLGHDAPDALEGEELSTTAIGGGAIMTDTDRDWLDSDFASVDLPGGDGTMKRREEYNLGTGVGVGGKFQEVDRFGKPKVGGAKPRTTNIAGMTAQEVQQLIPQVESSVASGSPVGTIPGGAPAGIEGIASGGLTSSNQIIDVLKKIETNTSGPSTATLLTNESRGRTENPQDFANQNSRSSSPNTSDISPSLTALNTGINNLNNLLSSLRTGIKIDPTAIASISSAITTALANNSNNNQDIANNTVQTEGAENIGGAAPAGTQASLNANVNVSHEPIVLDGNVTVNMNASQEEIRAAVETAIYATLANMGFQGDNMDPRPPGAISEDGSMNA